MGFHRLAIRIAALEAVAPSAAYAGQGTFATLAGPKFYDSRQDVVDELDEMEDRPIGMIFTEEDLGDGYGTAVDRPDAHRCALVFELQIASRGSIQVVDQTGATVTEGAVNIPVTDARHEALLDVMEGQVEYALRYGPTGYHFRRFATIRHIESVPLRVSSQKTRLAARTLSFSVEPAATLFPDPTPDPSPTGLAALPQPLADLARALPVGSRNRLLIESLASYAPLSPPLTPIQGLDTTWDLNGVP